MKTNVATLVVVRAQTHAKSLLNNTTKQEEEKVITTFWVLEGLPL